MRIKLFIPTKDRAAQTHLLLESLERNCPHLFAPYILFKCSNEQFCLGYKNLSDTFNCAKFYLEGNADKKDLWLKILEDRINEYPLTCFSCDDNIFYRSVSTECEQISRLFKDSNLLTFSFRYGYNTTIQDYFTGRRQTALFNEIAIGKDFIKWDYRNYPPQDNYGYPYAQDFHCYRTQDLIDILNGFEEFPAFRVWEGALAHPDCKHRLSRYHIASFRQSCTINNAVNSVQDNVVPSGRFHPINLDSLNHKYLNGEIIDFNAFNFNGVASCHTEMKVGFRRAG